MLFLALKNEVIYATFGIVIDQLNAINSIK